MLAFLDKILGLPAHPLLVHAAVVLVPLAAIGTIVIAFWPKARARVGWIVAAIGIVGFFFAVFAKQSGEALLETTRITQLVKDHAEMGDWGMIGAFLVGGSATSIMLFDTFVRWRESKGEPELSITRPLRSMVGVFAVVLSIFGTVMVINVGHSGAKATWDSNATTSPTVPYSKE